MTVGLGLVAAACTVQTMCCSCSCLIAAKCQMDLFFHFGSRPTHWSVHFSVQIFELAGQGTALSYRLCSLCMALVCPLCRRRFVPPVRSSTVPRWRLFILRALQRTVPCWARLFQHSLRRRFKQRCWAYLGHLLNSLGSQQFRTRLANSFPLHH